uniref:Uncharacterized protein n=1 Tax=Onchocerca volvulus TaxID=6282 RepID=A0A8R1TUC1_ONCVO
MLDTTQTRFKKVVNTGKGTSFQDPSICMFRNVPCIISNLFLNTPYRTGGRRIFEYCLAMNDRSVISLILLRSNHYENKQYSRLFALILFRMTLRLYYSLGFSERIPQYCFLNKNKITCLNSLFNKCINDVDLLYELPSFSSVQIARKLKNEKLQMWNQVNSHLAKHQSLLLHSNHVSPSANMFMLFLRKIWTSKDN